MARDRLFIPSFGKTSSTTGIPARAIALQAVWSILLVLFGGFEQILMYTGFAVVLCAGAAAAGLLFKGRTRTWREAIAPTLFVLASAAMVVDAIASSPGVAGTGVLLIAAGIPVYAWCRWSGEVGVALQPEEAGGD